MKSLLSLFLNNARNKPLQKSFINDRIDDNYSNTQNSYLYKKVVEWYKFYIISGTGGVK